MKVPSLKFNSLVSYAIIGLIFGLPYGLLKFKSAAITALVVFANYLIMWSFDTSGLVLLSVMFATMITMVLLFKYGPLKEGFNTHTTPDEIIALMRKMKGDKEGFISPDEVSALMRKMKGSKEGFISPDEVSALMRKMKDSKEGFISPDEVSALMRKMKDSKEGFISPNSSENIIEGYEDVKKEKDEQPAPALEKSELPMPFKLGEIPSQVKNGPHIDAGSTLMTAIKSLNPNQINAMTKDTQQLIETQKSLMGMLGTMKPMLNDGKELMETFQQMFGQ
jgi:hypothetical protein